MVGVGGGAILDQMVLVVVLRLLRDSLQELQRIISEWISEEGRAQGRLLLAQ